MRRAVSPVVVISPLVPRLAVARVVFAGVVLAGMVMACATGSPAANGGAGTVTPDDPRLPAWLRAPEELTRAPELEEAAALLCARDTDAVLDEEARQASHLVDGQLVGLLRRAPSASAAMAALAESAAPLLVEKRATHAGVVVGQTPGGEACAALVGARRLVELVGPAPAAVLDPGATLALQVRLPRGKRAALYTLKPDGFVQRAELPAADGLVRLAVPPVGGDGRYVLELLLDVADGPSDPEVALLWSFVVGAPRAAPSPEVLFPDEGHDDRALSHRAEALLQRLRNEQLIEPFRISPALIDVATARAQAVAQRGTLGHRIPGAGGATDARQDLKARFGEEPRAQFLRLSEVQAQASTLAEAWQALLESPAHRYELVDTALTHAGAAVARGQDAAGRPTLTLVALLARRPPNRDADQVRAQFLEVANDARLKRGLDLLKESAHLNRLATRLAGAMKDNKRVDETLLGGPIGKVALEADASLTRVQPLVVRTDDPLLALQPGVPPLLMNIDSTQAGVGMALDPDDGAFYLVILAGE